MNRRSVVGRLAATLTGLSFLNAPGLSAAPTPPAITPRFRTAIRLTRGVYAATADPDKPTRYLGAYVYVVNSRGEVVSYYHCPPAEVDQYAAESWDWLERHDPL